MASSDPGLPQTSTKAYRIPLALGKSEKQAPGEAPASPACPPHPSLRPCCLFVFPNPLDTFLLHLFVPTLLRPALALPTQHIRFSNSNTSFSSCVSLISLFSPPTSLSHSLLPGSVYSDPPPTQCLLVLSGSNFSSSPSSNPSPFWPCYHLLP